MTTPQPSMDSFELGDYLSLLRRRWWIVVGLACACLLLGAAYTVVSPKSYTATSSVFVTPNAANITQAVGGRTSGAINMDNESQIVQSDAVAALVAKQLHSTNLADLINQITVVVPANTTVLQISCAAPSAKQSAACAQDFANSYLASRQATAQTKINAQMQQEEARAAPSGPAAPTAMTHGSPASSCSESSAGPSFPAATTTRAAVISSPSWSTARKPPLSAASELTSL